MMATEIYKTDKVFTIDGIEIEISPLKIKYLRKFMDAFENVKDARDDHEAISRLSECVRISMQQFYPLIATVEDVEDSFDLSSLYHILDISAGIKLNKDREDVKEQANSEGSSWEDLDLAKLEAEVFEIGVWKNFEELELSLSISELIKLLETKRDLDYQEKKFFAAIQGVDLDKETGKSSGQDAWEKMKAKVFSGGKTTDPNDITSFQGHKAVQAGFGVGMGLGYEDMTKK
jgi:hypothetical protein